MSSLSITKLYDILINRYLFIQIAFQIIRRGDLDSYPLLKYLDMSNNNITDIEDDALGRLEILITLQLQHNLITSFPTNLPSSLVHLLLHDNLISDIQSGAFAQLENLETLDLSGNQLTYMPSLPLPRLLILNLRASGLRGLSQAVVKTSPNLKDLLLEGNPITCTALMSIAEWTTTCRSETPSADIVEGMIASQAPPQFDSMMTVVSLSPTCCGRPIPRHGLTTQPLQCQRETIAQTESDIAANMSTMATKKSRKAKMEDIWRAMSSETTTQPLKQSPNDAPLPVSIDSVEKTVAAHAIASVRSLANIITNNITILHPSPEATTPTTDSISTTNIAHNAIFLPAVARWRNGQSFAMAAAQTADVRQAKSKRIIEPNTLTPASSQTTTKSSATTFKPPHLLYAKKKILVRGTAAADKKPAPLKIAVSSAALLGKEGRSNNSVSSSTMSTTAISLHQNSSDTTSNTPMKADESRPLWHRRIDVIVDDFASLSPTNATNVPVTRPKVDRHRFVQATPITNSPAAELHTRQTDDGTNHTQRPLSGNNSAKLVGNQLRANPFMETNHRTTATLSLNKKPNHLGKMLSDDVGDNGFDTVLSSSDPATTRELLVEPTLAYNNEHGPQKPRIAKNELASILIRSLTARSPQLNGGGCHDNTCADGNSHKSKVHVEHIDTNIEMPGAGATTTITVSSTPLPDYAVTRGDDDRNDETNIYVAEQSLVAEIELNDAVVGGVMVVVGAERRKNAPQPQRRQAAVSNSLIDGYVIDAHRKDFEAPPAPQAVIVHSSHFPLLPVEVAAYVDRSSTSSTSGLPEQWNDRRSPAPNNRHLGMFIVLGIMIVIFGMLMAVQLFRCTRARRRQRRRADEVSDGGGGSANIIEFNDEESNQYAPGHRDMLPMELLGGSDATIQYSEAPIEMW